MRVQLCKQCDAPLENARRGGRRRKFCSESCRTRYRLPQTLRAARRRAGEPVITAGLYLHVRAQLAKLGHAEDYTWSQSLTPPATPEALACEYVWVVLNSGMKNTVARKIMDRVWPLLAAGEPIAPAFGHKGKVAAIERVWKHRADYFTCFHAADDKVGWCESLPWIGGITKYHLAKNLGVDVAKPDRWLVRLAAAERATVDGLCQRLAAATGDRVATVDVVLWRACAIGLLIVDGDEISLVSGGTK